MSWIKKETELGDHERLRILGNVRMLSTSVNLELRDDGITKTVVRDHAFHGARNKKFRATLTDFFDGLHFLVTDVATALAGINLLLLFLASHADFVCIDDDDEITRVHVGGEGRAGLTADQVGGSHGDLAEDLVLGINDPPLADRVFGFGRECLHKVLERADTQEGVHAEMRAARVKVLSQVSNGNWALFTKNLSQEALPEPEFRHEARTCGLTALKKSLWTCHFGIFALMPPKVVGCLLA